MLQQKFDPAWERKISFLAPRKKAIFDGTCPDVTDKEVLFIYQALKRRRLDDCARYLDELYPDARFKDVKEAMGILSFLPNKAARITKKVVKSACANATHNFQMDEEKLYVKACYADEGITMKRYMPRAKGSASPIMKRTSHITVVVAER